MAGPPTGRTADDREKLRGALRWVTTVDHEDIGLLYLVFGTAAGLLGGLDAMLLRTGLLTPSADVWGPETYNELFSTHGLTMLFLFATPVAFGLASYVVPSLIGADDMAFPRVNATAFWLLPAAFVLMRAGIFADLLGVPGMNPPATGWTLYPPLSRRAPNVDLDLVLLGLHLSGVSTLLSAGNFVVTIVAERADAVGWHRLDIFSWTVLTTSGLVLFAFPVLGSAVVMLLLDRNLGTTFFAVEAGGPLLWQHLFWFFGHPEVYILVLPPMGLLSHIIPKFAGRELFGFQFVVYSTLAIGVLAFGVWAHHMFTTGIDPRIRASFMAVSLAIALPSAVKTFNWIATMWGGTVRLTAPMLFCVGAIANFVVGGVTGVFLASIPVDLLYHGTYYVVGHFHFVLVGMVVFALFAASYYWFPLFTGRLFDPGLARAHFWLTTIGVVIAFLAMLVAGMGGLPRRMATYPTQFATTQQLATLGAYLIGFGQALWLWNVLVSWRTGQIVETADVWNLKESGAFTREWQRFERRLERIESRDDAAATAADDERA
ncbi:cbb3-type cytochrome c oxidase subunit I [Halococcus agarilyticus]|uniref:cbb3-type cytochrome c oxidase subunit I n=1 Tax=Halococcus agarilyticus TaxID=1232219 RepID=UPI000677BA6E|nr:cbb3-type cytochrome c oxidase subunit I [Halococcus agarilyticus]